MSYTNQTTHYGIPLPTSGDLVNLLDWNQSSEEIDAAIYDAAEAAQQAGSDIQTVAGDVSQLQTDLAGVQGNVTAIDGRVTSLEQTSGTLDEKVDDIADMITPREVTSAQSNIRVNVDELFRYNDVLYKCTVQINIGDTIVPNVNCSATNVETELAGGGGGVEIDDTTTSASKVWSSQKTNTEITKARTGDMRMNNGVVQYYDGSAWVNAQIGGAMVALNFNTPLKTFSPSTTGDSFTASKDCYLYGSIMEYGTDHADITIDGTPVAYVAFGNNGGTYTIATTKLKAGQTVNIVTTRDTAQHFCIGVYEEL